MSFFQNFVECNTYSSPGAYEASNSIFSGPGKILGAIVYNSSINDRFFQLFDGYAAPLDGANPIISVVVPAGTQRSLDFTPFLGIHYGKGLYWCNSSAYPFKVIAGTDLFVNLFYI